MLDASFNDVRSEAPGFALYLEHRFRRSPSLSVYGLDPTNTVTRADYGVTGTTTDAVVQWQPRKTIGFSARVGSLSFDLRPGGNDALPNAADVFGDAVRDVRIAEARYTTVGAGAMFDNRDVTGVPTRGVMANVAAWRFTSRTSELPSFTRVVFDARGYRSVGTSDFAWLPFGYWDRSMATPSSAIAPFDGSCRRLAAATRCADFRPTASAAHASSDVDPVPGITSRNTSSWRSLWIRPHLARADRRHTR